MKNAHNVTRDFEEALCEYTGAKYAVATDSCSSALLISLWHQREKGVFKSGDTLLLPKHTYMSVPNCVIFAGARIGWFDNQEPPYLNGHYEIQLSKVVDSALRFTADMMNEFTDELVCISFSGPNKHLKLGKGGAVLTHSKEAYEWLKRARFSGRNEVSYHQDNFEQLGINAYMLPEIAARGLLLMGQFYNLDGSKKHNPDLRLPYPDLSKFPVYNR